MKKTFFLIIFIPFFVNSQIKSDLKYYDKDFFLLEGTEIADSLKENRYHRLPLSLKNIVREPVWKLSKSSAGLSIRFLSNTSSIAVKWTVMNNNRMNHMPDTAIKGLDLYFNNNGNFQYLNTARPSGIKNEFMLMQNMSNEMKQNLQNGFDVLVLFF